MTIDHVAIWTDQLEGLKDYYIKYFGGIPNVKYSNERKQFQSYFLAFGSGARLELMTMPHIADHGCNSENSPRKGFAHLSFAVATNEEVEAKANQLENDGYQILSGPRITGDGYYEFETLDPDGNKVEVATKNHK